MFENLLL